MQVTLDIPDTLAAQLTAAGHDPARAALVALRDLAAQDDLREALRQGREDVAAGRTLPLAEAFIQFRKKHGLAR